MAQSRSVSKSRVHRYYYSHTKRVTDIVLAFGLLFLLTPILLIISITILITTGWPIFFRQFRYGQHKKVFTIHKFRVMYQGADHHQHLFKAQNQAPTPMYKNWQDPRFVGIGKWLSKTGLDELPQLLNIVKGEMSFVGPRPLPISEANKLPPSWEFRYSVKPGIFSEWSVSELRHRSLTMWNMLEKKTLTKGGIWYDIQTIYKTLSQQLIRRHAREQ